MLTSQRSYSDGGDGISFTFLWVFMSVLLYTCMSTAKFKETRLKPVVQISRINLLKVKQGHGGRLYFISKHIIFFDSSAHECLKPLSGVRQPCHMTVLSISTCPASAKHHSVQVPFRSPLLPEKPVRTAEMC